jgi:hypothetical protein
MGDSNRPEAGSTSKVKVDGIDVELQITDQSVMFEKEGKVSGFERSAIRMVKPYGDAMIIAYSVGSEVKSVRIEPMTAVASLLVLTSSPAQTQASATGLDEVFEKLYRDTRKELEDRLTKVQAEPENKGLRLTPDEEMRYSEISRQMENLVGTKYGFSPRAEGSPLSFWGLEKQPFELQLAVVKTLHISFLRMLVSPRAERNDIIYSGTEVWPDDWERILVRFKLSDKPVLDGSFKKHLESHWKYHPGDRKPVLAQS